MSTAVYPTLPGLGFNVKRTPQFKTRVMQTVSGMETRLADWSYPKYSYELNYEVLREHGSFHELRTLVSFWMCRQGSFDTFLFDDPDDNTITGQNIAYGNGTQTVFQLYRSFGNGTDVAWTDIIYAPNNVLNVYENGTPVTATVSRWGTSNAGTVTISPAPAAGVLITADFTYYFPCRFTEDSVDVEKFMNKLWEAKKISFITVKN